MWFKITANEHTRSVSSWKLLPCVAHPSVYFSLQLIKL